MIDPSRVGKILTQLRDLGDIRKTPSADDMKGDFDGWFDNGAFRLVTGKTTYSFRDLTKVTIGVRSFLSIAIEFPDGTVVDVVERDQSVLSDVCGGCGEVLDRNVSTPLRHKAQKISVVLQPAWDSRFSFWHAC